MEFDPQERRRQRREIAEKRWQKRKQLLIRLGIGAAILALCIILVVAIFSKKSSDEPDTVVHIVFGGDVNVTDNVVASGGPGYDYTNTFIDVASILGEADLSVVNFEGILYGAPYGTEGEGSAPQQLVEALDRAGVDLIQLANSYAMSRGGSSLGMTMDGVRAAGMEPVGVYASAEEAKEGKGYVLCDVGGVKVAFVAFTKGMQGKNMVANYAGCVNVLYTDYNNNYQKVDTEGITRVMDNVKSAKADIVVAMVHWGSEFNDTISSTQNKICNLLQENGADVIIGTHPHYVQKMAFDEKEGTFVAYSLGDFFGDAIRAGSEYSVILNLEITKDNITGETKVTGYDYTPIFTVREEGKPLHIMRIKTAMAAYENNYIDRITKETYDAMKYALTRIAARTKGE
jgi:poly-gamma-glutamate synthesis protein (capsule biosynthesis protein)